jgi:GT2 family glycosyltransferase
MEEYFEDEEESRWYAINKRITVLILNWNGEELLDTFLPSVVRCSPRLIAKIVVVDNGSTDDSVELVKAKFPRVDVISFDKNYGFAEGYNRAVKSVTTPFAVLLNNDVEVTPGWLEAPLSLLEADLKVACVQPKIRAMHDRTFFEYAGAAGGFMDLYGYLFCRGRIFDNIEFDYGRYDNEADILWASGACLFIRTSIYKAEGGLDPLFFAHQEEVDLCWRLRSRGYRIIFTPRSLVFHKGGGTLNTSSPQKTFLNFRNNLLMIYKNMPEPLLSYVMFVRFWLDRLAALRFYLEGNKQEAQAIFRARREYRNMKDSYRITRVINMDEIKVKRIPQIMRQSILWEYYVRRRKRFSELKFPKGPTIPIKLFSTVK